MTQPAATPEEMALAMDVARRLLHDKVHAEARKRHLSDATQSGYDHHVVIVAGEFAALAAIRETSERAAKMADTVSSIHCEKRDDALHADNHHGALTQARNAQTAECIATAIRNGEHLK